MYVEGVKITIVMLKLLFLYFQFSGGGGRQPEWFVANLSPCFISFLSGGGGGLGAAFSSSDVFISV